MCIISFFLENVIAHYILSLKTMTDMIIRDANIEMDEDMVMPVHPYDCQTGPKKIEERLPPPMQNKMYIDEALPSESLETLCPIMRNTSG